MYVASLFSSMKTAVPLVGVIMLLWMFLQQKRDKESKISTNMVIRNTLFVSALTAMVLYFATSSQIKSDPLMEIRPADF